MSFPLRLLAIVTSAILLPLCASGREPLQKPDAPELARFEPLAAPAPSVQLKKGDRLAICGDSITEQKMYSRILETYLTVALPELEITCRQFGWSGERAPGFLQRMKNDVLRFEPTIATTCYGMNDHEYRPYEERIGKTYREAQLGIVRAFREAGARVVIGSPGPVGKMPGWVKEATGTVEDLNVNLCTLRNIGIEIAEAEGTGFADVFWPMLTGGIEGRKRFGEGYHVSGGDGVHPGWGGQTFMAYAFLRALQVPGEIGTFTVDLGAQQATASEGHEVLGFSGNELKVRSRRYPFCVEGGDPTSSDSILSALALLPFDQELNRLTLIIRNAPESGAKITWGEESRDFSKSALEQGVNLAAEFRKNPFSGPFKTVWEAVGAKQAYETRQIKELFHGPEGKADADGTAAVTEKARAPLAAKIPSAMQPVEHTIRIEPM